MGLTGLRGGRGGLKLNGATGRSVGVGGGGCQEPRSPRGAGLSRGRHETRGRECPQGPRGLPAPFWQLSRRFRHVGFLRVAGCQQPRGSGSADRLSSKPQALRPGTGRQARGAARCRRGLRRAWLPPGHLGATGLTCVVWKSFPCRAGRRLVWSGTQTSDALGSRRTVCG